jgi:hypothetical protein
MNQNFDTDLFFIETLKRFKNSYYLLSDYVEEVKTSCGWSILLKFRTGSLEDADGIMIVTDPSNGYYIKLWNITKNCHVNNSILSDGFIKDYDFVLEEIKRIARLSI